jgi:hypothetical protein
MSRFSHIAFGLVFSLFAAGCGGGAKSAKKAEWTGPVQPGTSNATQRESVGITIYNQNFGVVREVRNVDLPVGRVSLEFRDVAKNIQPETVGIRSLTDVDALAVYEQNYRYDLLTPEKLLEKYVGKHVLLHRWNEALGKDEDFDAVVISTEGGAVFQIGDQITYGFPGRVSFPGVPPNLIAKPTLVWLLGSGAPKQKVEVTYLTQNLNWRSDYVLVVDENDAKGDLQGWVTLTNTSGASYENAKLKLVAGDVQRIQPDTDADGILDEEDGAEKNKKMDEAPKFVEEGFFEYHLYTLDQPTTVLDNEQKQVSLLEAKGVAISKKLIFYGANYYYRSSYGLVASNQKVGVYLDIQNEEKNHLGIALPKGIVRVYKKDKSGQQQFIGEDSIDHTPRDEKIRVKMGDAFDVVADKKQTDWKPLGECLSESAWEISVRNHKDTAETVELYEPAGGDWTIVSSSLPPNKKDQQTFTFDVKLAAKSEVKVTYRVRVRWC